MKKLKELNYEFERERNLSIIMNPNFWDKYPVHLREKELKKLEMLSQLFWQELKKSEETEKFYLNGKLVDEKVVKCKNCGNYSIIIPLSPSTTLYEEDDLCYKCVGIKAL